MTITDQLSSSDYLDKLKSGEPFVIKSANLPEITWDEILEILNADIVNNQVPEKKWLNEYGFRLTDISRIKPAVSVIDSIQQMFEPASRWLDAPEGGHELYISLTTQENAFGGRVHEDIENVLFWGLRGISVWSIYDHNEDIVLCESIGPGDLIFCPIGTKHRVVAKTPRAGISFSLGNVKEQF
jgi:hypothetical protein